MKVAVVGHVEWIDFARVERMPVAGEIVHAEDAWSEPGGGGAVAAAQLAKLAGEARFYTALGDDELGHRAHDELSRMGIRMDCVFRPEPQRRAMVHVDAEGERTITVIGDRLGPRGDDPLVWDALRECDAVYFTAGDAAAVRAARGAGTLVSTARGVETLAEAHVPLDALVSSARDPGEAYQGQLDPPPALVVRTSGASGGSWEKPGGERGTYPPAPVPGPIEDSYGCGDSFAAGLTYGLGEERSPAEALELAARCGAACLTGRGPYDGQLRTED